MTNDESANTLKINNKYITMTVHILRSIIFNTFFYGWTAFCSLIFLPLLILPQSSLSKAVKLWINGIQWICETVLGLHIKVIGREKLIATPSILAVKHQSAWETLVVYNFLDSVSVVLKQELLWIPFFGWYLKKMCPVPLSRSKKRGIQDLKNLLKGADVAVKKGRSILIFPEGTRSQPGEKGTYHAGVASLYLHLNIPVIPVAHNAGLFWPRRGFIKYPGLITLEFLDPIQPGLPRKEFMRILENKIESKTNDLVRQSLGQEREA